MTSNEITKQIEATPPGRFRLGKRAIIGASLTVALVGAAGAAGATFGVRFDGGGRSGASLSCPGGMDQLSHVLNEQASIFPGDPETEITIVDTIEADGFKLEKLTLSTHTGTHFDSPGHFIEGGRTVDQLDARELVWPAYVIDVRDRIAADGPDDFQLTVDDVRTYERRNGKIPRGALVILQTGFETTFGTDAYFDDAPGFAADTVQWLVDHRRIKAIGSDTFGPDATSDADYGATYTILLNDGFALPDLANLDSLNRTGDLVMASPVRLQDGSGYQVNPLACHGSSRGSKD